MKSVLFYLTFIFLALMLPVGAQTSQASATIGVLKSLTPEQRQALNALRCGSDIRPLSPQQKARDAAVLARVNDLTQAGAEALHLKNFAAAEADYRDLVQMDQGGVGGPFGYYGLGEALAGQGRTTEAIAIYKTAIYWPLNNTPEQIALSQSLDNKPNLRGCCGRTDAVAWMKYALLLSQTGQNAEAFSVYSQAVRYATDLDSSDIMLFSNDSAASPSGFQASIHVALGLLDGNLYDNERAMAEFAKALQLAPDNAVANYYYGYGWKHLDLKSATRAVEESQAKAALAKAAAAGDSSVKAAAQKALNANG